MGGIVQGKSLIEIQYGHLLNDEAPFLVTRAGMAKPADDGPRGMVNGVSVPFEVFVVARRYLDDLGQVTWRQLFVDAGLIAPRGRPAATE